MAFITNELLQQFFISGDKGKATEVKKVFDCGQMKDLDRQTMEYYGIPSCVLMERAALQTVEQMRGRMQKFLPEKILVVCGSGNNGGDGLAIARILFLEGWDVEVFLAGNPLKMTEETRRQYEIALRYQVPLTNMPRWDEYTTIVDAIFGIGLKRKIEGSCAETIGNMNQASCRKIAVDIPSGISGDDGSVQGTAFQADLTVTFAYMKKGLCLYPGRKYAGEIVTADIGISDTKDTADCYLTESQDLGMLPQRIPEGNKGTFGKVLVEAGSEGMCGAAYLCAAAAFRAGAGMVMIHTVPENRIPLQILLPEAMVSCSFSEEEYERIFAWCDRIVAGPGIGKDAQAQERILNVLKRASQEKRQLILDADGLNLLAQNLSWRQYLGPHVTVTPHPGEMSRLTGKKISDIREDLAGTAAAFAAESHTVCVLKDAVTAVTDGKTVYLSGTGNAGMATAGSGDVLAGILAGVYGMFRDEERSLVKQAALGVTLHGRAGDLASAHSDMRCIKAEDIIDAVREALR